MSQLNLPGYFHVNVIGEERDKTPRSPVRLRTLSSSFRLSDFPLSSFLSFNTPSLALGHTNMFRDNDNDQDVGTRSMYQRD